MKGKDLDGRRIRIDYSVTKVGNAPTPGQGSKGRPGRSPRHVGWNEGRRDGYDYVPQEGHIISLNCIFFVYIVCIIYHSRMNRDYSPP